MSKAVKVTLIAVLALLALLVIVVGIIAATFDPNDYKPQMIELVQSKKQRTLSIPGEIKLTVFPRVGADLGQVSLSEHKGSGEFAAFNSVTVSLELMPLLSKKLVVDQVSIDGLRANLTRYPDGSTNFDDLLSEEESNEHIAFDVASASITNAAIQFDDRQQKRMLAVSDLDLETGRIASGASSNFSLSTTVKGTNPTMDATLAAKSGFSFDLDQKHYVFSGMNANINGRLAQFSDVAMRLGGDADMRLANKRFSLADVALSAAGKRAGQALELQLDAPELVISDTKVTGGKLSASAKMLDSTRALTATFSAPSFSGTPQAFKLADMRLDATLKEDGRDVTANMAGELAGDIDKLIFTSPQLKMALSGTVAEQKIDGRFSTPVAANLRSQVIELPSIVADFSLPNPAGGTLKLNASGRASLNLAKQTISTALKGKLDESSFDARMGLANFSPPSYTFDIGIDRIDADRYRRVPAASARTGSDGKSTEAPIDLSALDDLRARGSLRVGALTANGIKASDVSLDMRAADGKLDVSGLSARLYGGTTKGALSASASNPARFTLRQNLTDINVGPLLQDVMDKAPLEGRGNVQLDVTTSGNTITQLKKSLNGSAALQLRDGTVRGINIAQTVRGAKAKLNTLRGKQTEQSGTSSGAEKTDFSDLSASFRINNGVARNSDLSGRSPLIRVGGAGDIHLGEDRLDYLVKVTVVSTLKGQGGPELEALKGVTIPVKLSGPFDAINWKLDVAGLVQEAAKEKIEEKKVKLKEKARERLTEELKGLFGR